MNYKLNFFKNSIKLIGCFVLVLSITACVNTNTKPTKIVKPAHAISKKRAKLLSNNYNTRYDSISRIIGKKDNRSTWYSLKELKTYIAYIEAQGKKQGYTVDGIRFYLGAYPADEKNPKKQNETTIFLAPTGKKIGNMAEKSMITNPYSRDITTIDAYNFGQGGWPPNGVYPNN